MDNIAELLDKAGLRRTKARITVLSVLWRLGHPMAHRDLGSYPGLEDIDRVTLYRTLETLTSVGLLHCIQGLDGIKRYSIRPEHPGCPGNHVHFLCITCGRMLCLTDQPMPWVSVPEGLKVKGKQFLVYGYCENCRSRGNQPENPSPDRIDKVRVRK